MMDWGYGQADSRIASAFRTLGGSSSASGVSEYIATTYFSAVAGHSVSETIVGDFR
jgi:hypothetical protein